jgi:uncharacterized membrane protein YkoI
MERRTMTTLPKYSALMAAMMLSSLAKAEPITIPPMRHTMEQCMNAVLAARAGSVTGLELEVENGVPVYEFKLKDDADREWEVVCNAMTGQVVEVSQELDDSPELDAAFKAAAKVDEATAQSIAVGAHPGKVEKIDREMDPIHGAIYEIAIRTAEGKEREVEVSAVNGLVLKFEEKIYEIGED